jgi:hypothetical protein
MSASTSLNTSAAIQKMYCAEDYMTDASSWKIEFTETGAVIHGCVYSLSNCNSTDEVTLTQTDSFGLEKPYGVYKGFTTTTNEEFQIVISGDDRINTNAYYKAFSGHTLVGSNQVNISCGASLSDQ